MSNPFQRGWGMPPAATVRVPCAGDLPLNLRPEVAPLFAELIRAVEKIKGSGFMTSSGGANVRPIRGYEKKFAQSNNADYLSVHSWAMAADFRAGTNPQRADGPCDMPANTQQICRDISPFLIWGGTFAGARRDPMHFEYQGSPQDAERDRARLATKNLLEAAVAELTRPELDRIMTAVDNYNRTWNDKQTSKVDGKPLFLAEGMMFAEGNLSKIAGFMERLVRKAGA